MKRRPKRHVRWGNSLGRRVIEPESFVSSSCVGDRFQNLKRRPLEKMAWPRPQVATNDRRVQFTTGSDRPAQAKIMAVHLEIILGDSRRIVVNEAHQRQ